MQYQIIFCSILIGVVNGLLKFEPTKYLARHKRDVVGALDIHTNHVQPIHADVKTEKDDNTKPCPTNPIVPPMIELGTVFQVIPPIDVQHIDRSLQKSLPITDTIDLVRSISRVTTLFVLLTSAIIEFFPLIQQLFLTIYSYVYTG
ncbi:uncharacterized protein LOC116412977 isoform X1 [Galleria mellonella]|uniref:Uncharacterized protein LOC116412977 isoform X1 n=1 Tax=Galleria mellonella TaxID=7137 RepID=A0A6J3BXV2_GALME|nr:uncharacterized protein LOC116412977 isoform X1 [Galleria mellonella]